MVEPSSLAETVTPSSFWPDRAVIAPLSSGSAACAAVAASRDVAHARSKDWALLIGVSLFLRFVRRHGNGSHISDDCIDLSRLEVILERRHAVGAVDDEGAHDLVVPAGRGLVQHRPVGLDPERRLQVADAARLREDLASEELRFVEIGLLRMSRRYGGERKEKCRDPVFHSVPPAVFRISVGNYPTSGEEFQPGLCQAGSRPCLLMTAAAAGAVMNL